MALVFHYEHPVNQKHMNESFFLGFFFVLAGGYVLIAVLLNVKFFFSHPKTQFWIKLLGLTGTKILYSLIGVFLLAVGTLMLMGKL